MWWSLRDFFEGELGIVQVDLNFSIVMVNSLVLLLRIGPSSGPFLVQLQERTSEKSIETHRHLIYIFSHSHLHHIHVLLFILFIYYYFFISFSFISVYSSNKHVGFDESRLGKLNKSSLVASAYNLFGDAHIYVYIIFKKKNILFIFFRV